MIRAWVRRDEDGDRWCYLRLGPLLVTWLTCLSEGGGFVDVHWMPHTSHARGLASWMWA